MTISKGKVMKIEKEKIVVEIDGEMKSIYFLPNFKLKKGDNVMIVFGNIVDKIT